MHRIGRAVQSGMDPLRFSAETFHFVWLNSLGLSVTLIFLVVLVNTSVDQCFVAFMHVSFPGFLFIIPYVLTFLSRRRFSFEIREVIKDVLIVL